MSLMNDFQKKPARVIEVPQACGNSATWGVLQSDKFPGSQGIKIIVMFFYCYENNPQMYSRPDIFFQDYILEGEKISTFHHGILAVPLASWMLTISLGMVFLKKQSARSLLRSWGSARNSQFQSLQQTAPWGRGGACNSMCPSLRRLGKTYSQPNVKCTAPFSSTVLA